MLQKTVARNQRASVMVYQGHPAIAQRVFNEIGQGHLSQHQQYAYMLKYLADGCGVKIQMGVE
jgi:hypothetical protein